MMKKLLSVLMSVLMVLTLMVPVFAEEEANSEASAENPTEEVVNQTEQTDVPVTVEETDEPVAQAEEPGYKVEFDYESGITITPEEGRSLDEFAFAGFSGNGALLIHETSGLKRVGDTVRISKFIVKDMLKNAYSDNGKFTLNLMYKDDDNYLHSVFSVDLEIDTNLIKNNAIDPDTLKFSIVEDDYGRVWYQIEVTDEQMIELNPFALYVYYGDQEMRYDYSDSAKVYRVDDYYINSHIVKGTYTPVLKATGYEDYQLPEITVGYKENKMSVSYDSETGELIINFSACSDEDKAIMMDVMLINREDFYEKYSDLGFYAFGINGVDVENSVEYGDNQPIYKKDDNTLAVKGWAIDKAKNPENSKDRNSGFIQLPGYVSYQISNFTVESESLPEGFGAKIVTEKDEVYFEVECVSADVMSKVYFLQYFAMPLVHMEGGVGVWTESLESMEARGVLTYVNDHCFRVKLNSDTDPRFNGDQGFNIKIKGMYGKDFGETVKAVVAPKVGSVDSTAATLADITLTDGWPNITLSKFAQSQDSWHWVDPEETVNEGTVSEHYAEIEVWDYVGSEDIYSSTVGVDYEAVCKNLSNVDYVVTDDGHHYLRAKLTVSVPQSAGAGIKTSVTNFDPVSTNVNDEVRADVNKIKETVAQNNVNEVAYYDIKLNDGETKVLDSEAEFKVALPEWVINKPVAEGMERKYTVVSVHDGEVRTFDAKDNGDGTVSFGSKLFSIFTLTYVDVIKESTNTDPGNGNQEVPSVPVQSEPVHKAVVNTSAR